MKRAWGVVGALLIIGTIFGGNLQYLSDWNTGELIGFNAWTLIAVFGGGYLVYWAFFRKIDKG